MIQALLLIFSCASIFLFSTKKYYKWGFVAGLCGQPFWLWYALDSSGWGVFAVAVWYSFAHVRGIKNHFGRTQE